MIVVHMRVKVQLISVTDKAVNMKVKGLKYCPPQCSNLKSSHVELHM